MAARFADQVLVVSDGRLVAHGAPVVALTDDILRDVFRVAAFRASADGEPILLPWSEA
jgi:iron complex transport system ATP-binding protein